MGEWVVKRDEIILALPPSNKRPAMILLAYGVTSLIRAVPRVTL